MPPRRDRFMRLDAADGDVRDGPDRRPGWWRLHVGSGAGALRRRDADPGSRHRRSHCHRVPVGQHPRRLAGGRALCGGTGPARSGRPPCPCRRPAVDRAIRGGDRGGAGGPRRLSSTPTRSDWRPPRSSAQWSTTEPSPTRRGTRIRSPCTRAAIRRCLRRHCARPGQTACVPTLGFTPNTRSKCRCCRCTPAECSSSPDASTREPSSRRCSSCSPTDWTCRRPSTASCRGRTRLRPGRP